MGTYHYRSRMRLDGGLGLAGDAERNVHSVVKEPGQGDPDWGCDMLGRQKSHTFASHLGG